MTGPDLLRVCPWCGHSVYQHSSKPRDRRCIRLSGSDPECDCKATKDEIRAEAGNGFFILIGGRIKFIDMPYDPDERRMRKNQPMNSFRSAIAVDIGTIDVREVSNERTKLTVVHPDGMTSFAYLTASEVDQLVTALNAAVARKGPKR